MAEVDAIGSSRGQAVAIGFGHGAAGIADIVDKRATKTVTETLNPKKWIEDLIDAGQSEIEPIEGPTEVK